MYNVAEDRKVNILKAINRKWTTESEKINIRKFVSDLLGVTISGPFKREFIEED